MTRYEQTASSLIWYIRSVVDASQWIWISVSRGRPDLSHSVPSDQRWTRYRDGAPRVEDVMLDACGGRAESPVLGVLSPWPARLSFAGCGACLAGDAALARSIA